MQSSICTLGEMHCISEIFGQDFYLVCLPKIRFCYEAFNLEDKKSPTCASREAFLPVRWMCTIAEEQGSGCEGPDTDY